ncbi:MAG: DUF1848 domain-containing protein [Verrucomicrobiota bacterium]|nr:DUF1848 domain-containing protein [Verrucomicrobiota bacterium]
MLISASRRTDIPAFYGEWFMRRLRAGWCGVANPFHPSRISRVSLRPEDVDAIVFWTRDPAPLEPRLDEIAGMGFRYYFLFTLTPYGPPLEPHLPPHAARREAFRRLAARLGPARVIWRYDPIILSTRLTADYHVEAFVRLADELKGSTERVIVSFLDFHRKTERRLAPIEAAGGDLIRRDPLAHSDLGRLTKALAEITAERGMELQSCAEDSRLDAFGIKPGKCVDADLINRLFGAGLKRAKDKGQRPRCLCAISRDIGAVDTCRHGCAYCYSTASHERAIERARRHDPAGPMLIPAS